MPNSSPARESVALFLFVSLAVLAPAAWAASEADLDTAIRHFEFAEFSSARAALLPLVEAPALSEEDRRRARTYLAASEHALGDEDAARAHLRLLHREAPETRLDPGLFLPDLVSLSEEVRGELARERALLGPSLHAGATQPVPHVSLAFLPFGTGQFANGQTTKGIAFLAGEALLFGASTFLYSRFVLAKEGGPDFLQGGQFRDVEAARRLQIGYFATFWAGMSLNVAGVIDALLTRQQLGAAAHTAQLPPQFPTVHERRP